MSKIEPYKSPLPKGFYENLKNLNREVNFKQGIGFYKFSTPIPDTPPVRPISSPDPIHIIMKMVDDTMPVQMSFDMNITYETLTRIVAIINEDPIYQQSNKIVPPLVVDVDSYNATGKVRFIDGPKIVPFGRKINL